MAKLEIYVWYNAMILSIGMHHQERNPTVLVCCDGMAAAGKGTLMEYLKNEREFLCISSGFMYRAITAWALAHGFNSESKEAFEQAFEDLHVELTMQDEVLSVKLSDGILALYFDLEDEKTVLRSTEIDMLISFVSSCESVQTKIDSAIQKVIAEYPRIVLDGRDTYRFIEALALVSDGVLVIPYALYLFAQTEVLQERAKKRLQTQAAMRGEVVSAAELEFEAETVTQRNEKDFTRTSGRLLRPEDAQLSGKYDLVLDTSEISADEVAATVWADLMHHLAAYLPADQWAAFFAHHSAYS